MRIKVNAVSCSSVGASIDAGASCVQSEFEISNFKSSLHSNDRRLSAAPEGWEMRIGSVDPLAFLELKKTQHKCGEIDSAALFGIGP